MKIESYKMTMFSGISVLHTKFHYRSCLVWLFFVLKMKNKSLRFYTDYTIHCVHVLCCAWHSLMKEWNYSSVLLEHVHSIVYP